MLYKPDKLSVTVKEMHELMDRLVPYTNPTTEIDLTVLKTREIMVDGYNVVVYYTKSQFEDRTTKVLQIYGRNMPFLPFYLLMKVARRFLGSDNLSLVELIRENRKIYCWSVNFDLDGKGIPLPEGYGENCNFEGFQYSYLQPNQVNFY